MATSVTNPAEVLQIDISPAHRRRLFILMSRMDSKQELYAFLARVFDRQALVIAGLISKEYLSGQRLKRRTGNLARDVTGKGGFINGIPAIRVGVFKGPSRKYYGVQELGTKGKNAESPFPTIRPKKPGGYLAIPVAGGGALTPAGVSRFVSARDFPGKLVFLGGARKVKSGGKSFWASAVLVKKSNYDQAKKSDRFTKKRDGRFRDTRSGQFTNSAVSALIPVYALLRKVDLKPNYYLRDGVRQALPKVSETLLTELTAYLSGKNL